MCPPVKRAPPAILPETETGYTAMSDTNAQTALEIITTDLQSYIRKMLVGC